MKSGAESGVAAARWPWARGGDYGQESSLPAAALLLAGSLGLGWAFGGSAHPSLSRGDPRISGFGWKMLLPWRRHQPRAASGEEGWLGEPPALAPRADACLCPGVVFGGAGIPGICEELGSGWGRAGRLLQHEPSGLFRLCARQCLG